MSPKLITTIILLSLVAWVMFSGTGGCHSNEKYISAANKSSILHLEQDYHKFHQIHGRYPQSFDEIRAEKEIETDDHHFIDYWSKELIVIFPEDYEKNELAQTYTVGGNVEFYNTKSFQILVVYPESGKVLGNFSRHR